MTEAVEKELMKFEEPLRSELREAYNTAADKRSDAQKQLLAKHPSVNITPGVLYQYNQAAADELKKFDERHDQRPQWQAAAGILAGTRRTGGPRAGD